MTTSRPLAELLERQLRHRYRALDRAISAGVGPAESEFQLGGRPPIAWHARHVGEAIESTREALFGDAPRHTARDLHSRAPSSTGGASPGLAPFEAWPEPWHELRLAVLRAGSELAELLSRGTDEELAEPPLVPILPAFRSSLPTRQSFLEGHIYHVTYHVGSMAVLRAEMGLD